MALIFYFHLYIFRFILFLSIRVHMVYVTSVNSGPLRPSLTSPASICLFFVVVVLETGSHYSSGLPGNP